MKRDGHKPEAGISRADFLKFTACAGAALLAGGTGHAAVSELARRPIPKSGEMLPVVGLGTARTFDVEGTPEELAPRKEVLRLLFASGAKVIDTAPIYGRAESVVGRLLAELGARDKAFIATKISTRGGKEDGLEQYRGSLRDLRTNRFELLQVHNLKNTKVHLNTVRALKDAGKVRYAGITHFRPGAYGRLAEVMESEPLDFVQLKYSLSTREAEQRLLPLAADKGIAVLVNRPYDLGRLFRAVRGRKVPAWAGDFAAATWGQFFLKFILAHPAVTCVVPGTRKPHHLSDNIGAGRGPLPGPEHRRRMVQFIESI